MAKRAQTGTRRGERFTILGRKTIGERIEEIRAQQTEGRLDGVLDMKIPGAKNDAGKLRYGLLDDMAIEALIAVLTYGANKYTPNGWRKVEEAFERYDDAYMRHRREFRRFLQTGVADARLDSETMFPHTAQMLCNALFLCAIDLELHDPTFDGTNAASEAMRRWQEIKASTLIDLGVEVRRAKVAPRRAKRAR